MQPTRFYSTDLSGFTPEEIELSELIVNKYAEHLRDEDKPLLLHHIRTFATTVAGRHFVSGFGQGASERPDVVKEKTDDKP